MNYISGWCKSQRRLDGYTAIVTGCNTGIGKETVKDFYLRGARVIMACRDLKKAAEAKKDIEQMTAEESGRGNLVVQHLDVASLRSVKEFAFRILDQESCINILVNNAGVMCCPEGQTEDGFETHIGTNHYGHALLTLLLLPRLIKSAPARIVSVSSLMHIVGELDFTEKNFQKGPYHAISAYSASKAANVIFARALAEKLKEHNINGVTTYSLHPGVIATDLGRHFSSTLGYGTTWIFQNILSWFLKSPRCGAQTSIYCAVDEACANQSGLYYSDCAVATMSRHCEDDDVAAELWTHTTAMLNLAEYNPFAGVDPDKSLLIL